MKDEFCNLPTFERSWDRIEILLKSDYFRALLKEDEKNASAPGFEEKLSKLDLMILGFLWCSGSKADKAEVLFNITGTYRLANAVSGRSSANASMI